MRRFLLLVVALSCFVLSFDANAESISDNSSGHKSAGQRQDQPSTTAQQSELASIDFRLRQISRALDAQVAQANSGADQDRAQRNLKAQENIANWGPYMFALGLVEIIVTIVGVYLVFGTLKETRSTAKDSAAQAKIAHQTYISSNRTKLRVRLLKIEPVAPGQRIAVRYEVINVGGTNAKIIDNEITMKKTYWLNNQRRSDAPILKLDNFTLPMNSDRAKPCLLSEK